MREKSDIIFRYYNGLLKTELIPVIEKLISKLNNARLASPISGAYRHFGEMSPPEFQHLLNNPMMAVPYASATDKAITETAIRFGSITREDGFQGNAFQHAVWNCLIIRAAMYKGYTKNNAILFTRNITSDHECDDDGNRIYDSHSAMDLHNNLSARSFMGNNTSGGTVWPFYVSVMSESTIFDAWYNASLNQSYHVCNSVSTITALYNWDFLYGEARGNMEDKLYYIFPVPPGC